MMFFWQQTVDFGEKTIKNVSSFEKTPSSFPRKIFYGNVWYNKKLKINPRWEESHLGFYNDGRLLFIVKVKCKTSVFSYLALNCYVPTLTFNNSFGQG